MSEAAAVEGGQGIRQMVRMLRRWALPVVFVTYVLVGLAGQIVAPSDPSEVHLRERYIPPLTEWKHVLGTDQIGRDILSRTLVGASLSLSLTALVIACASAFGVSIGMIAGFLGGHLDTALMRLVDAVLALPGIMLALLLVAIISPGFWSVALALMLVDWARYARFVRGEVLSLRSREYIDAAIVCGTSTTKILWRHILPNVLNSVVVLLTLDIGRIVLLESSLAFLGLGLPPDRGAWGSSIAEGKSYLQLAPWIALTPALAMMVTILLANSFGNWLSDRLDPRLRAIER
jgi:peptide/nickel transport system permease protein